MIHLDVESATALPHTCVYGPQEQGIGHTRGRERGGGGLVVLDHPPPKTSESSLHPPPGRSLRERKKVF